MTFQHVDLNRLAQRRWLCENQLVVIPGVAYPHEKPAALRSSADATREWFTTYLRASNR